MKRGEHQRGHALLWIPFSRACFATLIGSTEFFVDRKVPVAVMYWVFGVGLAVCPTTLLVEARRDVYTAAGAWVLVGSTLRPSPA